ncbi:6-phosphofructokinase II [Hafnia paralvei]|uniref:6-phosphofructokinase II n=1 Tax=Hafnia paralvei TaxID=546367 RepID=UPI0027B9CE08|nr:6-phosphofructokinase II [Hafnia paralvei]
MTPIFTLTLAPSLDTSTTTAKLYPDGKLRCSEPIYEPGGGGINVARAIAHLGGKACAIFPAGGPTGQHLAELLQQERVEIQTVKTQAWTRQNMHVHTEVTCEQYRFVMPGAKLTTQEFEQLRECVLALPHGSILVISGSLPEGVTVAELQSLIRLAQTKGIECVLDSSGQALIAGLEVGGLLLVKPNQKELSELSCKDLLEEPSSVLEAAQSIVAAGKSKYVVVSLGAQGALAVAQNHWVQVVPPPVKMRSTVGAGDSMVGAMVLKLSQQADLLDIARYGVAAGSAATLNKGTRLCQQHDVNALYGYLCQQQTPLNDV